ncbi:Mobile element protein [Candidatus Burkholderia verschuerenii]|uniref:Mobile element protein n=1 Tax=Candidatus Burkholderia verschuerenii TaxID=242163 RepID=A0A0L0M4W2_9BURK|nr:Mobile element protein [Candidatus Burkholderia verschuerenii]
MSGTRITDQQVRLYMSKRKHHSQETKRRFKATTDSNHNLPVAPNLLQRDFSPARPDQAWSTDITDVWTDEGWLYLTVILDLFSRLVVGWSMQATHAHGTGVGRAAYGVVSPPAGSGPDRPQRQR